MRFVVLFLSYIFTVVENISSSIFALVTKKSNISSVKMVVLRKKWNFTLFCIKQVRTMRMDLRAATKGDPEWLKEQRKQEVAIIEKWISEYYTYLKEED